MSPSTIPNPAPSQPGRLARFAQAMAAPIRPMPPTAKAVAALACMAFCMGLALANIEPTFVFMIPDSTQYLHIAWLDSAHVGLPFASRQLGGLAVHALMVGLHLSIYYAFQTQAAISFAITLTVLYWLMAQTSAPRWLLFAVAVLPYWAGQMQYLVLPDVFYSALLAVLIVLLAKRQMLAAALMMFPLMVSRESTSLTLVCFLIALWSNLRWLHRLTAVVATVAAAMVVGHLTRFSPPNMEHLPPTIYMLAKVPWNLLRNIGGVLPWSNVNMELCTVPRWSVPLHFGPVRGVGFCGFRHTDQYALVSAILTQFGLLPLLIAWLWWQHRRRAGRSPLLRFVLLYGAASFVLAPMLGNWMAHLEGYAWPLFLVGLPLLFNEFDATPRTPRQKLAGVGFCALHLAAYGVSHIVDYPLQICLELAIWIAGYGMLRLWWPPVAAARVPQTL